MQRAVSQGKSDKGGDETPGTLFMVATPIGNLEDITFRALNVLKNCDLIAAENRSHTKGLCGHYDVKTRITAFNQHNQKVKAPELIRILKSGKDVALVTDAGTPGISDPGGALIKMAAAEGILSTPVPGPSAVAAALSVSGFPSEKFVFLGFLPVKAGKRRKELKALSDEQRTMVLFEAPHRLIGTLKDIHDILGNREMVVLREISKVFEEIKRGPAGLLYEDFRSQGVKGELTLVMAGDKPAGKRAIFSGEVLERISELLERGMTIRDISETVSSEYDIPYRKVYKESLARMNKQQDVKAALIDKKVED